MRHQVNSKFGIEHAEKGVVHLKICHQIAEQLLYITFTVGPRCAQQLIQVNILNKFEYYHIWNEAEISHISLQTNYI